MPRPKVHPDARQRVVSACRQCKASKRKCNASLPCAHCIKRGVADSCEFIRDVTNQDGVIRRRQRQNTKSRLTAGSEPISNEQAVAIQTPETSTTSVGSYVGQGGNIIHSRGASSDVDSPNTMRAHMLVHNQGERVYIGRHASLSFLQLVRETVSKCIGPSEFSEYVSQDQMLEIDHQSNTRLDGGFSLNSAQKQQCVDHYFLATNGLFYILTSAEAMGLLNDTSHADSNSAALRLLVIAIGVQAGSVAGLSQLQLEKITFNQARNIAFSNMLETMSLDLIRIFLLMSFYMLGACRRNAAYMYLGIAARAAHTLGLHSAESYKGFPQDRLHARLRCWKSLVSLDLIVSSILGRSAATSPQRSGEDHMVKITNSFDKESHAELEATYRLAIIVDLIANQFSGPTTPTTDTTQAHLQTLRKWTTLLPVELRPATTSQIHKSTRQALLGSLHISCFYYFAVMLVTRPFLIVHVIGDLTSKRVGLARNPSLEVCNANDELAAVCLNAAMYMAQTCTDALHLNLLAENMCLLKAWIFAAGLVLGFRLFACSEREDEIDQAFKGCCQVLGKLAVRSPQAAQYQEILDQLGVAIDKHRKIQQSRKQRRTEPLLERMMNLNYGNATSSMSTANIDEGTSFQYSELELTQDETHGNGSLIDSHFSSDHISNILPDLNSFLLPSDESFAYDLQTFGTMPWDVL